MDTGSGAGFRSQRWLQANWHVNWLVAQFYNLALGLLSLPLSLILFPTTPLRYSLSLSLPRRHCLRFVASRRCSRRRLYVTATTSSVPEDKNRGVSTSCDRPARDSIG